jgi:hypothetical protein
MIFTLYLHGIGKRFIAHPTFPTQISLAKQAVIPSQESFGLYPQNLQA